MKNFFLSASNLTRLLLIVFVVAVCLAIDATLGGVSGITFAMAGGGSQFRNAQVADGAGWDRKYNITNTYAALLENVTELVSDDKTKIIAWYNSSTAFSSNAAQYNSFPVGSIVFDIQGDALYMHDSATTWKTEALS